MKHWKLWQLAILVLLGLGVLLSQIGLDTFAPEPQEELLEVSVLLREPETSVWSNTRRGMEQSALDWGVELRFLTLPHSNDTHEQLNLLVHEAEGGADGIILAPCDVDALSETVVELTQDIPIVTLESDMQDQGALACIAPSQSAIGQLLGLACLNGIPEGGTVLLIDSAPHSAGISQRLDTVIDILSPENRIVEVFTPDDALDLSTQIQSTLQHLKPQGVVALEPHVLELTTQITSQMESPPLLYGVGASALIASHLERSDITAIAVQNEYAIGYLAVETVVQGAKGNPITPVAEMDIRLVRQENMYDSHNEKLLFPVTH